MESQTYEDLIQLYSRDIWAQRRQEGWPKSHSGDKKAKTHSIMLDILNRNNHS